VLITLEHKGGCGKNGATKDKLNNAISELEYQDNAEKTNGKSNPIGSREVVQRIKGLVKQIT